MSLIFTFFLLGAPGRKGLPGVVIPNGVPPPRVFGDPGFPGSNGALGLSGTTGQPGLRGRQGWCHLVCKPFIFVYIYFCFQIKIFKSLFL